MSNPQTITIHKLNHESVEVWRYTGQLIERQDNHIIIESHFNRDDYPTDYHTFKRGDRMVEWFFADRWYNVFALYSRDNGQLEGWYCNITRPAKLESNDIYADDLALDVMVYPDGRTLALDEDEFAALDIDETTRLNAEQAFKELLNLVKERWGPFAEIRPDEKS